MPSGAKSPKKNRLLAPLSALFPLISSNQLDGFMLILSNQLDKKRVNLSDTDNGIMK